MRWLIVFLLFTNTLFGQFTYSGYIYNANGTGAVNVPVKLYRRTTPTITGFTNQQNYNGHSYYRSTGSAYWLDAKANCAAMGGHLVTVTTSGENSFLYNLWPSGWIGLTDEVNEGVWRWVTGETYSYTSWNPGEPNNAGNEDYVQFVGEINIADEYLLFARKAGIFNSWTVPDCRFYTTAQYNSIVSSSGNVRTTYPGVTSVTTSTLVSGGTLNYYLIAPGYSGSVTY
jgi:hypothetical protein